MVNRDPVTGRFMKARRTQKKAAACVKAKAAKKTAVKKAATKTAKKTTKSLSTALNLQMIWPTLQIWVPPII